ncbi:alpha-2A adrenergic receptor-like [Asterias amurensis]|uniref:alpha-2A adrenergic receptor-like n=1 Tax=Asterias amurensis TaxID=7602 RepID=UPI003AB857CD
MDNFTNNGTFPDLTTPTPDETVRSGSIFFGLVLLVLVVITIAGNILTISAFVSNVLLRQKPSNLLLLSLSFSDLMVGATGLPVAAIHTGLGYWPLGRAMCVINAYFSVIGVSAGMYTITAVSLDRYFLVSREYPAYLKLQSSRNVKLTIAAAWIIATLISSVEVVLWLAGDYSSVDYSHECLSPVRSDPRFVIVIFFLLFVVPFLVMLLSTLRFSILLRRRLRKPTRTHHPSVDSVNNKLVRKVALDGSPRPVTSVTVSSDNNLSGVESTELSSVPASTNTDGETAQPARPIKRKSLGGAGRKKSFFGFGDAARRVGTSGSTRDNLRNRYRKPAVRLAILLGVFALCTLPYPIFIVLSPGSGCEDCPARLVRNHLSNLLLSNSGLNPFLYAIMHRKIWQFYKNKLTAPCKRC